MKIGDKVKILQVHYKDKEYVEYEIIKIYDKKYYNMYLCKSLKGNVKTTFTDFDIFSKVKHTSKKTVEVIQ